MAVIGYPQRLTTLLTTLFQRGQRLLMRRFQARGSSSHIPSPAVLVYLLLLSGYTCCQVYFAIQRYNNEANFTLQEAHATPELYLKRGTLTTKDLGVIALAGSTLGGGTVVNWTTSKFF